MKTGLVLEGGAMRGLFTAGVLDVLMESGIKFDMAVGVSAGAAFGCNYKSGQIGRVIRYNLRFAKDWRYRSFRSLLVTGDLYGGDFCYHKLPDELDPFDYEAYRQNPMEFYAVVTDMETGKPMYKSLPQCDFAELEWMRASASMPLASKVVEVDGHKLLDGGISDSIPLEFAEKQGCDKSLVILTQPADYVKSAYKIMPIIKASLRKFPNTVEAIRNRHEMYNAETAYVRTREAEGSAFVIRPPQSLGVSALENDPQKLQSVYDLGRKAGVDNLGAIKKFLEIT
ncbi:MAG: patatin family protein [Saccharofermentans sp.]|nr:patatin family protein [Saccharofermentans sp.]